MKTMIGRNSSFLLTVREVLLEKNVCADGQGGGQAEECGKRQLRHGRVCDKTTRGTHRRVRHTRRKLCWLQIEHVMNTEHGYDGKRSSDGDDDDDMWIALRIFFWRQMDIGDWTGRSANQRTTRRACCRRCRPAACRPPPTPTPATATWNA